MERILIIEADPETSNELAAALSHKEFSLGHAPDGITGLGLLRREEYGLFVLDLDLPDMDGLDLLREVHKRRIGAVPVVLADASGNGAAHEAMLLGAYGYIQKGFDQRDLLYLVTRALSHKRLEAENSALLRHLAERHESQVLAGTSPEASALYSTAQKAFDSEASVLIQGEPGTGKTALATLIHSKGPRSRRPISHLNCAAVPESMLEAEFFGRETGSFSSAAQMKPGKFEQATGGTVVLEDVDRLHPALQGKVLRAITERSIVRVGGNRPSEVDVRAIATSRLNLSELAHRGRFDKALLSALSSITLDLPPLRKRPDDIPVIIARIIETEATRSGIRKLSLSHEALSLMLAHEWPGNLMELREAVNRMISLSRTGNLKPEHLPADIRGAGNTKRKAWLDMSDAELPESGIDLPAAVDQLERAMIKQALKRAGGVKTNAAKLLGLNRTTLIEKIKKKKMLGEKS